MHFISIWARVVAQMRVKKKTTTATAIQAIQNELYKDYELPAVKQRCSFLNSMSSASCSTYKNRGSLSTKILLHSLTDVVEKRLCLGVENRVYSLATAHIFTD